MSSDPFWTMLYVAIVAMLIVRLAAAAFPSTWWGLELNRWYGVIPTGPFGIYSRRDHVRRAIFAMIGCICCAAAGVITGLVAEHAGRAVGPEWKRFIPLTYSFGFVILAGMGLFAALGALWRAIFWKPQAPPRVGVLAEWVVIAEMLDRLGRSPVPVPVPLPEWQQFVARPFSDPSAELIRRRCVQLCGGNPSRFSGVLRTRAVQWARLIRAASTSADLEIEEWRIVAGES